MTSKPVPDGDADTLRRAAEARLQVDGAAAVAPFTDLPRLVHELQVHQVELEMQNSELREARAELEQHRDRLEELVAQRTSQLRAADARATLILQSSADGLVGADMEGRITFINPAACALLGYSQERALGQNAHNLFHHEKPDGTPYPEVECFSHKALAQGDTVRVYQDVFWHADGHAVPVMYAVHPVMQDGVVTGTVSSVVDMSVQRAAQRAQEVALIAAENLARLRSEFLANMSHEIRTPLNGVLGFAEIGALNYQNPEKALSAFKQIVASGTLLLRVINDILDFSKIEAGKLNIEETVVHLTEVISSVVDLMSSHGRAKQLTLQVKLAQDMPRRFLGDPLRLGQVLNNLLANAIKFSAKGDITLSAARQGEWLEFRVADTGIGMSPEQVSQLFQPFQQADGDTARKFGGTGLGLAISKRILELMHGDISVESQPGLGSTFTFRLPYRPAPAEAGKPEEEPLDGGERCVPTEKRLRGVSILVAEDSQVNQAVILELLSNEGAEVVQVNNGQEAIERVVQDGAGAYDIVLMDVQMPVMDGYEATRQLLAMAPALPVIGQTARAMAEEKARCLEAGMVDHISKPFDPKALVEVVSRHLKTRKKA